MFSGAFLRADDVLSDQSGWCHQSERNVELEFGHLTFLDGLLQDCHAGTVDFKPSSCSEALLLFLSLLKLFQNPRSFDFLCPSDQLFCAYQSQAPQRT